MGVGETGQIIGETGVGETGVGEMGVIHQYKVLCQIDLSKMTSVLCNQFDEN